MNLHLRQLLTLFNKIIELQKSQHLFLLLMFCYAYSPARLGNIKHTL